MADRFYIGPYDSDSGLQTNYRPFVIPEKAFDQIQNAYVFRGRVRKRFGSEWLGNSQQLTRLKLAVGTLAAPGLIPAGIIGAIGEFFSVGDVFFTVNQLGVNVPLLVANGSAAVATIDTTAVPPTFVINGVLDALGVAVPLGTTIYFYPALPVMGLLSQESNAINSEPTIAFDTRYSYQYITATGWERIVAAITAGASTWTGSNSQFFWGANWSGAEPSDNLLFVTNFNQNEPNFMRYFTAGAWNNFRPRISAFVAGPPVILDIYLDSALMLIPFKNHLIALNTWESSSSDGVIFTQRNYPNRARWSQIGSPVEVPAVVAPFPDPVITLAWRQDLKGRGGGYDAPTREQIVSAEFVKDRLVVYFEKSTWELVYTNNAALPFVWQQINTELGAESTFSIVPFDKVALGVGNVGIHACNGQNTERIDAKIPQLVFKIHNDNSGVNRVYGIRDYTVEMVYWTFPSEEADTTRPFPNRVLVYNYLDNTWALNDDSITVFGYFQPQIGVTWDSSIITWDDTYPWDAGSLQSNFRQVIAGNQQGWTFIVNPETTTNTTALQVTDITNPGLGFVTITSIDHNLREGEYVQIEGVDSLGNLALMNGLIGLVVSVVSKDTFVLSFVPLVPPVPPVAPILFVGPYAGGGRLARVTNPTIKTKMYNFYAQKGGRNAFVSRVDFLVDRTDTGQILVDYFISSNITQMVQAAQSSSTLIGTSILETTPYATVPFEQTANQLWHPIYLTADGEYIQLYLHMDDAQNRDTAIQRADFQLHAMIVHAEPSSQRLQ